MGGASLEQEYPVKALKIIVFTLTMAKRMAGLDRSIINRKMTILRVYNKKELVHMAEMHSQARVSSPYELVPNILRYTFNNLYLFGSKHRTWVHVRTASRSMFYGKLRK